MKKLIHSLVALSTFIVGAAIAHAQPAPKILVIDMGTLFDKHYKTEEQGAKLKADEQKAQDELGRLNTEGNAMVEKYKELIEQVQNPALTGEAKSKAQADAQKMGQELQRKQQEVQAFQQNTRATFQQRIQNFRLLMIEEISKLAIDIAKKHGATILLDKSGQTLFGVSNVIYTDPSYDITDEVMKEINKDRPAPSAAPATTPTASSPSAAPSTDSGEAKITLPGQKK